MLTHPRDFDIRTDFWDQILLRRDLNNILYQMIKQFQILTWKYNVLENKYLLSKKKENKIIYKNYIFWTKIKLKKEEDKAWKGERKLQSYTRAGRATVAKLQ